MISKACGLSVLSRLTRILDPRKSIKRSVFILSAFIVAGSGIFIYSFFFSKEAGAAWFNESWLYRTPLTITHNAEVLNNKVKFDIDTATLITAGKMQGDCGDTRFTDTSGKLLKYYLDSANGACNTDSTDYYVLVPKVINGTTVTYHYYGNPSAPNGTEAAQFSEATLTPSGSYAAGSETQGPGPVGYWKFDDGSGTNTQDSSSSGKDGTITGATWQPEDRCVAGKCLYFDGTGDYTAITDSGSNDLLDITGAITLEVWVQKNSTGDMAILSKHNSTDDTGYLLNIYQDKVLFQFGDGGGSWPYSGNLQGNTTLSENKWYHIAVTRSGSSVKIYVNGKLDSSPSVGTNSIAASSQNVWIGRDVNYGNDVGAFVGKIDDVKIYPYARSAAQVKTDYQGGAKNAAAHSGTSAVIGSNPSAWISDGLVGYWKMDDAGIDAEGETSTDSSGNSNTGTLYGDNGVGDNGTGMNCTASGKFGSGCNFDGVDDYISLDPSTAFDVGSTGDFSASLWVKSSATNDNHLLRAQSDNDNYWSLYHEGSDDLMRFRIQNGSGNSDILAATTTVENGNWHFVTIVRKNSGTRMEIYIDGALNNSSTSTARSPGTIGQFRIAEGAGNYIDATIDEIRVYNRALTSAEISSLYNWAPGPVGYWDFEEGGNIGIGSTAFDRSGNNNPGIWSGTGTKHTDTGKYGKAGKFDGSSDYVSVGNISALQPKSLTIEAWVNLANRNDRHLIVTKWEGYTLEVTSDGLPDFDIVDVSDAQVGPTASSGLTWGQWAHIAGTYDESTSTMKTYLNGVLVGSGSTYTGPIQYNGGPLEFSDCTYDCAQGQIDDVRIYNYARTAKQIVSDMNAEHPNVGSPVGSALGHWKFDEGQGTVANNSGNGGSTYNGTITNATWSQAGKYGKALSFDGSGDYMEVTGTFLDTIPSEMTWSLWFKPTDTFNNASANDVFLMEKINSKTAYDILRLWLDSSDGKLYAGKWANSTTANATLTSTQTSWTGGTWYQAVLTYSTTSGMALYVNGIKVASSTDTSAVVTGTAKDFIIAADNWNDPPSSNFTGALDEVKVYNYALTADEVKLDYNKGSSLVLGTAGNNSTYAQGAANQEYCVPGDGSTCTAPVGRWDFEEAGTVGVGSTAYDTSGNNYSGAWAGTSTTHTTPGKTGKAGKFNGTDDFVDIPTNTVFNDVRTISAWFKITGGAGTDRLIVARDIAAGLGGGWGIAVAQNNQVRYHMNIGGTWRSFDGSTPALNTWYFVAATYDGTALRGYLNGVPDGSSAQTGALGTGTNPVRIGGDSTGGTNRTMVGSIDQVRIFDYARSAAQVAYDYNRGAPVGHWKLDECQGATAYDSSGNKNNGTITIGATDEATLGTCTTSSTAWGSGATGKRNASLSLDGTDDYVDIGNQTPFQFGTGDFSASFWMKANAWSGYTAPLSNSVYTSSWDGFHFEEESGGGGCTTGGIRFEFPDNTRACWNSVINTGTWYHVVGVRRSGTATIYVNGVAGGSSSATTANVNVARDFLIGRNPDITYPRYFNGQIDDVRIYNYALTATQVKDIMNQGAVFFGPSTGSP